MRLSSITLSFLLVPHLSLLRESDMLTRSVSSVICSRRDCTRFWVNWPVTARTAHNNIAESFHTSSPARMGIVVKAADASSTVQALNVLGTPLRCCCKSPMTGYYRDGFCRTGGGDYGVHVVCAQVTEEFLEYTRARGNDLSTPAPHFNFPGLKPGDRWCLCASRWKEAADAGKAPPVVLSGCHIKALDYVDLALLQQYAVKEDEEDEEDKQQQKGEL